MPATEFNKAWVAISRIRRQRLHPSDSREAQSRAKTHSHLIPIQRNSRIEHWQPLSIWVKAIFFQQGGAHVYISGERIAQQHAL